MIFGGRIKEDPIAWLESFETAMSLNNWTQWANTKNYIKASFWDNALLWYKAQVLNLTDWDIFKTAFKQEYCTQEHMEAWRDQIKTRKQRVGESVEDVIIDIRMLIGWIEDPTYPLPEATKVNWILRAVHPETAMKARDWGIKTMEDCYKELPQIEMDYIQYGSGYQQKFIPDYAKEYSKPEEDTKGMEHPNWKSLQAWDSSKKDAWELEINGPKNYNWFLP